MGLRIAIIGCSNVGKSSLFNRLIGKKLSIVDSEPNVTRDRVEGMFMLGKKSFSLVDTAALNLASKRKIDIKTNNQTAVAIKDADVVFLVIDGKIGLSHRDDVLFRWLKKFDKPIVIVLNKSDTSAAKENYQKIQSSNLRPVIFLSAEHGLGLDAVGQYLRDFSNHKEDMEEDISVTEVDAQIKISIVGRPLSLIHI